MPTPTNTAWIRECQECGYLQKDNEPIYGTEPSDSYCNRKCKKCKSEALDYGKTMLIKNGNYIYITNED